MINKCEFIGHLGADPELTYVTTGDALAKFSLATNETWKDKSGQKQEKTEWIPCQAWGKLAEIVGEYGHKGQLVYICGKYQTREYEDKIHTEKRRFTSVKVSEFKMLSSGKKQPEQRRGQQEKPVPASSQFNAGPLEKDDVPF